MMRTMFSALAVGAALLLANGAQAEERSANTGLANQATQQVFRFANDTSPNQPVGVTQVQYNRGYYGYNRGYRSYYRPNYGYRSYYQPYYGYRSYYRPYYSGYRSYYRPYYSGYRGYYRPYYGGYRGGYYGGRGVGFSFGF